MDTNTTLKTLSLKAENGILTITIERADKLNALNIELLGELKQVIADFRKDTSLKGAILTGSGDKAFAAGADIAEFSSFNEENGVEMARNGHEIFNSIERSPKAVIAAVNGFALGGGCELAMACHMRVATPNAKFGQPEVNLGLIPGYGGTQRLVQLIGKGKANELLMTGDMIDAEEARRLGLVNHVVESEQLLESCAKILGKIGKKAPLAIGKVIDCVNAYHDMGRNGFETEIAQFGACMSTEDFREGTAAFLEKRKAEFKGT